MLKAIDLDKVPNVSELKMLEEYFDQRQQELSLEGISNKIEKEITNNEELSVLWSLQEGNDLRMGSPSEQAIFLIKWAQEEFYLLHSTLIKYIPTIDTDLKNNVIRVSQKIREEEEMRELPPGCGGYQFMTDILRARIIASDAEDLINKVTIFENIPGIRVIRYKPKFYAAESDNEQNIKNLQNVTINFIWSNSFICELQVRLGK